MSAPADLCIKRRRAVASLQPTCSATLSMVRRLVSIRSRARFSRTRCSSDIVLCPVATRTCLDSVRGDIPNSLAKSSIPGGFGRAASSRLTNLAIGSLPFERIFGTTKGACASRASINRILAAASANVASK